MDCVLVLNPNLVSTEKECLKGTHLDGFWFASTIKDAKKKKSFQIGQLQKTNNLHGFVAAVHLAFAQHKQLCVKPDDFWLLIQQGLAIHINENKQWREENRKHLVDHQGKVTIQVRNDALVGQKDEEWRNTIHALTEATRNKITIAQAVPELKFSTTTPDIRTAHDIVWLDSLQEFFNFEVHTFCGIKSIKFEGSVDDWKLLATTVESLHGGLFAQLDLQNWSSKLVHLCNMFKQTTTAEQAFWNDIYKLQSHSGGTHVNGWLTHFFPYLNDRGRHYKNPMVFPNDAQRMMFAGVTTNHFPSGISTVPFQWIIYEKPHSMILSAGFSDPVILPTSISSRIDWLVSSSS